MVLRVLACCSAESRLGILAAVLHARTAGGAPRARSALPHLQQPLMRAPVGFILPCDRPTDPIRAQRSAVLYAQSEAFVLTGWPRWLPLPKNSEWQLLQVCEAKGEGYRTRASPICRRCTGVSRTPVRSPCDATTAALSIRGQACRAQHSTAQHSTAQHSTAQHSCRHDACAAVRCCGRQCCCCRGLYPFVSPCLRLVVLY